MKNGGFLALALPLISGCTLIRLACVKAGLRAALLFIATCFSEYLALMPFDIQIFN